MTVEASTGTAEGLAIVLQLLYRNRFSNAELEGIGDETIDCAFMGNFLEHLPDCLSVLDLLDRIRHKLFREACC
jgi:hypothetical protein